MLLKHTSDHILNMHAHFVTLTWQKRNLLEAVHKFACKVCCKNWNMDYENMLGHLNIPTLQQRRLKLKASMMYHYLCTVTVIIIFLKMFYSFIPLPTMTQSCNCSYFSGPYARKNLVLIIIPSSHMLRFWNSLPPTVAQALSTLVLKRLIEFYV